MKFKTNLDLNGLNDSTKTWALKQFEEHATNIQEFTDAVASKSAKLGLLVACGTALVGVTVGTMLGHFMASHMSKENERKEDKD